MTATTFDTLKFAKRLEAAGVPAPQAEAFAEAVREAQGEADLATKADIESLRAEIAAAKASIVQWVAALLVAQAAAIAALVKLL
jgi:hypothetical protein